jgi:peptide chain release factor subunit 1
MDEVVMSQLQHEHVRELVRFDGGEHLILSVYLNTDPERQFRKAYRTMFKDLCKDFRADLESQGDKQALEDFIFETTVVDTYLEREKPHGKGLALFTCSPKKYWFAEWLRVTVPDTVEFTRRPYVRPLLDVLDEYERYAVALVDKRHARLFTVYMGQIEEHKQFRDFVPGKHDQGGWSQANYQRHHEEHVYWHLKHVVDELLTLLQVSPFDRLILAGPDEVTSDLRPILPYSLSTRLVATISASIDANEKDILQSTLKIEHDAERTREETLVAELINIAAAGGRATIGVAATLEAIWYDRVHRLIVAGDLRITGSECPRCGFLTNDVPKTCSTCGGEPAPISDVVERAIERTLEHDALVEFVHGNPASRLKEKAGGLGAQLRF